MSEPVRIGVNAASPYRVTIGRGLLKEVAVAARGADTVAILYQPPLQATAEQVRQFLAEEGFDAHRVEIPDAEAGKDLQVAAFCWDVCGRIGLKRNDKIISLGGGAATDLAGFVAATWMRASASFTSPRPCSRWLMPLWAGRPESTPMPARTWSARSTSPMRF